jgi:hypothetical protein
VQDLDVDFVDVDLPYEQEQELLRARFARFEEDVMRRRDALRQTDDEGTRPNGTD